MRLEETSIFNNDAGGCWPHRQGQPLALQRSAGREAAQRPAQATPCPACHTPMEWRWQRSQRVCPNPRCALHTIPAT